MNWITFNSAEIASSATIRGMCHDNFLSVGGRCEKYSFSRSSGAVDAGRSGWQCSIDCRNISKQNRGVAGVLVGGHFQLEIMSIIQYHRPYWWSWPILPVKSQRQGEHL
jgi:hypothetical protein